MPVTSVSERKTNGWRMANSLPSRNAAVGSLQYLINSISERFALYFCFNYSKPHH